MGKHDEERTVTRRDVLKLAGTAAAFCTSFGFLHAGQTGKTVQDKPIAPDSSLQYKWEQAEIKWYAGNTLLHSAAIPAKVAKHLGSDLNAAVEVKLFRSGQMLKSLGAIQAKH
jgi:hypothetical protein